MTDGGVSPALSGLLRLCNAINVEKLWYSLWGTPENELLAQWKRSPCSPLKPERAKQKRMTYRGSIRSSQCSGNRFNTRESRFSSEHLIPNSE
jgi:hypothetical protein